MLGGTPEQMPDPSDPDRVGSEEWEQNCGKGGRPARHGAHVDSRGGAAASQPRGILKVAPLQWSHGLYVALASASHSRLSARTTHPRARLVLALLHSKSKNIPWY